MNNSNALPSLIRIDQYWLATEPLDMRAGPDTALARVIKVFGQAKPHHAYLFANKRGNRMKVYTASITLSGPYCLIKKVNYENKALTDLT